MPITQPARIAIRQVRGNTKLEECPAAAESRWRSAPNLFYEFWVQTKTLSLGLVSDYPVERGSNSGVAIVVVDSIPVIAVVDQPAVSEDEDANLRLSVVRDE
jgi:hypothetical protein